MERDYSLEIDQLRREIAALKQLILCLTNNSSANSEKTDKDGHIAKY